MSLEATANQNFFEGRSGMSGYFRHFGFKRDPFGVEEKETSLYLLPNWEQQIDLMLHYIRHENVLLTLTGPKGIGKTTLINFFLLEAIHGFSPTETAVQSDLASGEFLVQLGGAVHTCQVLADSTLNPEHMIEVIASAFDVSTEHFLGSFESQSDILLDSLQYSKQNSVLLIDDAHELPDATLGLLLYMVSQQSENQHRFHVVLIGESEIKKRLAKINKSKDYNGLTYSLELEPLNLSQTEYYLKHRFASAGLTDEILFSNGIMNKIYKLSGGVPKIINQLARQSLLEILKNKKRKFSSLGAIFKPYKKTFIGGGFLLASFAIILLYLGQDVKLTSQHTRTTYHSVVVKEQPQIQLQPQKAPQTPTAELKPAVQEPLYAEQSSSPATAPTQSIVQASSLIEPDSIGTSENAEVKVPLLLPSQKSAVKESIAMKHESLQSAKHTSDVASTARESANGIPTEHVMKKDIRHYTLKLTDTTSEAASKAFIARYKLGSNVSYYRVRTHGVDKYSVVYGEYANAETAKRAILFLPKTLQHLEPKPYQLGSIQNVNRPYKFQK